MSNPLSGSAVSLKDIARQLDLSHGTVSKALRNNPEISEATRERVQKAARRMGYHPNPMGAGLAEFKRTSTARPLHAALAWLNLWPTRQMLRAHHEFDLYWQGASRAAEKFGYRLEEFYIDEQLPPHRLENILLTRNIHGILIPPVRSVLDWTRFNWSLFSTVRISRVAQGLPEFHTVTSAQAANATLAYDKIRERGYKRVGYIGHRTHYWTYLGGFLQAQANCLPETKYISPLLFEKALHAEIPIMDWNTKETLDHFLDHFVSWHKRWKPDAIITESPEVFSLLKNAGLRVPEDLAVAALNVMDLPWDAGICQNPEEIGRVSSLALISLLNDRSCGLPTIHREVLVKGSWVEGTSLPPR